jgi:hypothetical protein
MHSQRSVPNRLRTAPDVTGRAVKVALTIRPLTSVTPPC